MPVQAVQCPEEQAPSRRRAPSISHAIPAQPDPTPTRNPQNSKDQTSNHETHSRELHAKLLGQQGQLPQNLARNSIGRSFNKVRKRCNSNDLNSIFERVTGELRAKLGVDSVMRQARCGRDTCAVAAGPGRASRRGAERSEAADQHTRHHRCGGRRRDRRARAGFETRRRAKRGRLVSRAAGASGAWNTRGATSTAGTPAALSRNYSPARRSTSCMMRPHTALTHATAATPRTRERQGLTCRKSSKP